MPSEAPAANGAPPPAPDDVPSVPRLLHLPAPRSRVPQRKIDPIGIGAIAVSGLAGWCAMVAVLSIFVIPLAVAGLLTGLVGLAAGLLCEPPRYILATAGSVTNVALLIAAIAFPSLLGPTYQRSRERVEAEAFVPHAVALPGKKSAAPESTAEWPDAMTFSVQVKQTRIQVMSAEIRPLEIAQTPKKKFTKESYLVLRVRAHQPAGGAEFASDGWGQGGTAQERRQPTLTDETGKVYRAPPANLGGEEGGSQRSQLFPLGITDEVYLFEAPGPSVVYLRLEIPAEPWGGSGAVRFTIPRAMFRAAMSPMATDKDKAK